MFTNKHGARLYRNIILAAAVLIFPVNSLSEEKDTSEAGILYTNVEFKGYTLLVEEIIIKNISTGKEIAIRRYKDSFVRQEMVAEQKNGFVYQKVPAGRYYVSELRGDKSIFDKIELGWPGSSIRILDGYINYIGDIVITVKNPGREFELLDFAYSNRHIANRSDWEIDVDISPDVERVKSFINERRELFLDRELVFIFPGARPVLVNPEM